METDSSKIREILRRGECFQAVTLPIYRLADEELVGHEMLTRGPDGPYRMPDEFFRVAIEEGVLTEVDLHCLRVCVALASEMDPSLMFHCNLFPSTIIETPVEKLLALFPEDRRRGGFCIEIIEQQKVDDYNVLRESLRVIREAGFLVAVDDVGFGASYIESLILLEPDIIKIDRRFIIGAAENPDKERQLRRLVKVAKALDTAMVAEGISSRGDLELARRLGVDYGQGVLWGMLP